MREYLQIWQKLGVTFDGLYCGFLGNEEQIDIVREFTEMFHPPVFLLDPVMGDHGKAYSSITKAHIRKMRELLPLADILTPNLTEACLLTGTPWHEGEWSMKALSALCQSLAELCQPPIASNSGENHNISLVITGIRQGDSLLNFLWDDGVYTSLPAKITGANRPGTGDIFASILAADAVNGETLLTSVQKAASFIGLCIAGSERAGIPVQEGVQFEKYLSALL